MHLKKKKFKSYKYSRSQALTEKHKLDRKAFCKWLLEQSENFPQKIIFGDEKIWRLDSMSANRQNNRIWSVVNPHRVMPVNNQGRKNYMCSVMFFNGRVLEPYWFVDQEGKKFNINQARNFCSPQNRKKIGRPQRCRSKTVLELTMHQIFLSHCSRALF